MVDEMKRTIDPQVSKQILQLTKQPEYNYIGYFKYDIEILARFVLNRIERAYGQVNYDHFFNSEIRECQICETHNLTSRDCFSDINFKKDFVKSGIQMFEAYPLEIERKKLDAIDDFKKKKNVNIFTDLYNNFLGMFGETRSIEVEMQNKLKNRLNYCCSNNIAN